MNRAFGYLVAEQCRTVAGLGVVVWSVLLVVALVSEWLAGVPIAYSLHTAHLAALATVVLPFVIAVAIPLATGLVVLRLHERRELQALWLLGRGPHWAALALLLPVLPCALILHRAVHEGRPAAFAELATLKLAEGVEAADALSLLQSEGLGVVRGADGIRVLADLGEHALAVDLADAHIDVTPVQRLGPGEFVVMSLTASPDAWRGSFAEFEVFASGYERSVGSVAVRELGSAFLGPNRALWSRLRAPNDVQSASRLAQHELSTRFWAVLCFGLASALVLWPLWWRRVPQASILLAGVVLPALLLALVFPRWLP